jgi:hypothetical protein
MTNLINTPETIADADLEQVTGGANRGPRKTAKGLVGDDVGIRFKPMESVDDDE